MDAARRISSWRSLVPEDVLEINEAAGFGGKTALGRRPALLVIDVTYQFVGDRPEPILESIRRFPLSCGAEGWDAVPRIAQLLAAAREFEIPIFYTQPAMRRNLRDSGRYIGKSRRTLEQDQAANRIVEEIAPHGADTVIAKPKPSAFFGTPLVGHLFALGIDSLLVCGATTSGCVRATVVDAFSNNLPVAVVEEATFDRHRFTHEVNLFDIVAKYGDVIPLSAALDYMRQCAGRTAEEMAGPARSAV